MTEFRGLSHWEQCQCFFFFFFPEGSFPLYPKRFSGEGLGFVVWAVGCTFETGCVGCVHGSLAWVQP